MLRLILLCGFLLVSGSAAAEIHYIPDDFPTIMEAIIDGNVNNGDTLIVRPGTYAENINYVGKSIAIISEMGPEDTTLQGDEFDCVVTFENQEGLGAVLAGFTITNGSGKDC